MESFFLIMAPINQSFTSLESISLVKAHRLLKSRGTVCVSLLSVSFRYPHVKPYPCSHDSLFSICLPASTVVWTGEPSIGMKVSPLDMNHS